MAAVWILYWSVVALVVLVWWKGDTERESPGILDQMKRIFVVHLFNLFRAAVRKVAPSVAKKMTSCEDIFFNRPNPIFAGIYWVLFGGGYGLFVMHGFKHIPNMYFSENHKYLGSLWVFLSWAQFIYVGRVNPGRITNENLPTKLADYEFDYLLYEPKDCQTCGIARPARSKHCKVCGICVSKFDHHCIWINSCVGEGNHRGFLLFLLNHSVLMLYIFYAGVTIAWSTATELELFHAYYFDENNQRVDATYMMIFNYLLHTHSVVVAISIFVFLLSFLFIGFLGFQCYLVTMNTTTNEFFKWSDIVAFAKKEGHLEWIPKRNPYDVGWLNNWQELLWPPLKKKSGPQVIKFRESYTEPAQMDPSAHSMDEIDAGNNHAKDDVKQKEKVEEPIEKKGRRQGKGKKA